MNLERFFSQNNSFLGAPIKKNSIKLTNQRKCKSKANYHRKEENNNAVFYKSFYNDQNRRMKTECLNEWLMNGDDGIKQQRINQKINKNNASCFQLSQGIKTKSLKFEYYYKHIKLAQQKQKSLNNNKSEQKNKPLKFSRQFSSNLNQQMLQSMKKYLKRIQKNKLSLMKSSEQSIHYGLDIKTIQNKKRDYIEEFKKIKQKSQQAKSSLLEVKKCRSLSTSSATNIHKMNSIVKKQKLSLLENMLCKKKIVHSQKSKSRYQFPQNNKYEDKTLNKRIQSMIKNLQLVLNSHKCFFISKQDDSHKKLQNCQNVTKINNQKFHKYKYFVGYGNNKNLIRSIMKKRWWWTETYDINQANFVWTQLKVALILNKVYKENMCLQEQKFSIQFSKNTLDSLTKTNISIQKIFQNRIKNMNKYKRQIVQQHQKNYFKFFHPNTPIQDINVYQKYPQNFISFPKPTIAHNHYQFNYMFGNKNALFHNLKKYCEFMKIQEELFNLVPKTYYLEKFNRIALKQFQMKEFNEILLKDNKKKKKSTLWILKPAQNSNRGQGISVHTTFESLKKQINETKIGKFIVQEYIKNLFLYQKRKFDIRTYLLMTTIGNVTKFYWYNEGYLRTSSEYYNTNDTSNIFIHLTNDAIQCDGQKYGKFQPGNKITYSQFQRYLQQIFSKQKYSLQDLNNKMKSIALKAVQAIYPKLKTISTNYSFQLFGLDFLIDNNFKPWLLEINTNPCLELSCPALQRIIPRMLENMFRICLDPVFQPSKQIPKVSSYFIYDNLFSMNKFQLIFDSYYDKNQEWERFCDKNEEEVYADEDEVFENDGEEIEVEI